MTELGNFEAALAALPPLPEEVRATVLVIWLAVVSGRVELSTLRELCLESQGRSEANCADAMMLDIIDQLIAHSGPVRGHQRIWHTTPAGVESVSDWKHGMPFTPARHVTCDLFRQGSCAASQRST